MRRVAPLLMGLIAGCQCFEPVFEDTDAGPGTDAGVDAGRPGSVQASDCAPESPPRTCGFSTLNPSRSCFDGHCVFDCESTSARTCSTRLGSCLSCDGGVPGCGFGSCPMVSDGVTGRIYRSCTPAAGEQLGTFVVRYRTGATCNFKVFFGDGGVFGGLDLVGDEGTAEVADEPAVTCTARGLATALNRVELGCSRCLYMLEWP